MKITQAGMQNNQTSFTAKRIAVSNVYVNGLKETIDIYKLDNNDNKHIKKVLDGISLNKLVSNKSNQQAVSRWQGLIGDAGMYVGELPNEHSYLAVKGKKACGILVGTNNGNEGFIEVLAKWPTKAGEKIKGVGKALLTPFIETVSKTAAEDIKLEPMSGGPSDCAAFYKKQNFSFIDKDCMSIKKQNMAGTVAENKKLTGYKPRNDKYTDLSEIIDLFV